MTDEQKNEVEGHPKYREPAKEVEGHPRQHRTEDAEVSEDIGEQGDESRDTDEPEVEGHPRVSRP